MSAKTLGKHAQWCSLSSWFLSDAYEAKLEMHPPTAQCNSKDSGNSRNILSSISEMNYSTRCCEARYVTLHIQYRIVSINEPAECSWNQLPRGQNTPYFGACFLLLERFLNERLHVEQQPTPLPKRDQFFGITLTAFCTFIITSSLFSFLPPPWGKVLCSYILHRN